MSEPTIPISEALASDLQRAIHALPIAHCKEPQHGETVDNQDEGYVRLQDWAFTKGFALVKESTRSNRVVLHCIHHHKEARNSRKTLTKDCKRLGTTSQAKGTMRSY